MRQVYYPRPQSSGLYSQQPLTVNQSLVNSPLNYSQIHMPQTNNHSRKASQNGSGSKRYSKPREKENDKLKNEVKAL